MAECGRAWPWEEEPVPQNSNPMPPKQQQQGLSDRRLKQYSGKHKVTVGLTGARAGDELHGLPGGDCSDVVLRVHSGVVRAPAIIMRSLIEEVGSDRVVASVARHFGLSNAAAELRMHDFPTYEDANHLPLGSGCNHGVGEGCTCEPAARYLV